MQYAKELDSYIDLIDQTIDAIKSNDRRDFADAELSSMCMRLPILIYRVSNGVERSALESDVAKAMIETVRAQRYIEAPGKTIPEKKAQAEIMLMDEATVVDLARHVYMRLKRRTQVAELLFDGIRKVMTQREKDKEVFRNEQGRR